MNTFLRIALVSCLILGSAVLLAQNKDTEHASHHATGTTPAATAAPSESKQTAPGTMQQMQDNMKAMQEQMAKINSSKDTDERQALLEQHMQAMHQQMDMMRNMMSSSMMGKQTDGQKSSGKMNCGKMMGGNMDMMQMMMNQMQQHASAEDNSKTPK